jgi:low temperature requirement protein LtrA
MAEIKNPFTTRIRNSGLLSAETSREGDRATTLELFFDLIYVFAPTGASCESGSFWRSR